MILAAVTGQDPEEAFREALAEHRQTLVAELGDDVAERVVDRLNDQSSPEEVRQVLREELGRTRLAVDEAGQE